MKKLKALSTIWKLFVVLKIVAFLIDEIDHQIPHCSQNLDQNLCFLACMAEFDAIKKIVEGWYMTERYRRAVFVSAMRCCAHFWFILMEDTSQSDVSWALPRARVMSQKITCPACNFLRAHKHAPRTPILHWNIRPKVRRESLNRYNFYKSRHNHLWPGQI